VSRGFFVETTELICREIDRRKRAPDHTKITLAAILLRDHGKASANSDHIAEYGNRLNE
jgi:hypothetical protein